MMVVMKSLRSPLLHIHGDKELAQIAAACKFSLSLSPSLSLLLSVFLSIYGLGELVVDSSMLRMRVFVTAQFPDLAALFIS
jgi:hypothetical protein